MFSMARRRAAQKSHRGIMSPMWQVAARFRISMVVNLVLGLSAMSRAQSAAPTVTPQRPSFSNNTSTTFPGWLELESGVAVEEDGFDSPLLLKYGALGNAEIFLGVSPVVAASGDAGVGNLNLGGRLRFLDAADGSPALAGLGSLTLPTSTLEGTDDRVGFNFVLIASRAWRDWGVDLNLGTSFSGGFEDGQLFGIWTLSKSFGEKISGYAEGLVNRDFASDRNSVVGGVGGAYMVSSGLVVDSALNFNISNAAFDVQFLAGATVLLTQVR
ncbi:MAG: transporter [Calditrichaeota bacterium]|nr:MAG: transporter [Calditrichota bacterium]